MQIIESKPITWKVLTPRPDDFPCFICHVRQAEIKVKVRDRALDFTLVVCAGCSEEETIFEFLRA